MGEPKFVHSELTSTLYYCIMGIVGERLRAARERAGLSLGQVHQYEGIQKGHLSEMEQGSKNPTGQTIARLAARYRTTADYLLGLTEDPSPRHEEPLSQPLRDALELARGLSPGRQLELVDHVRVLEEAERRERNERQAAMYLDRAEAMGEDVLDALLTALDLFRVEGRPAAEAFIRSFWVEKAKQMTEKDLHNV